MKDMATTVITNKLVSDAQRQVISLVVTRSLLARMLGYNLKRIEVWAHVVWVLPEKGSPRFISKSAVWNAFRDFRRTSANELRVLPPHHPATELALVSNPNNNSIYSISLTRDGFYACECLDYLKQVQVLGPARSVCKHIFAYRQSIPKS